MIGRCSSRHSMRLKDGAQREPLSARTQQFLGTTAQVLLLPSAEAGIVVPVNRAVGQPFYRAVQRVRPKRCWNANTHRTPTKCLSWRWSAPRARRLKR
jgi:hypothetical protein